MQRMRANIPPKAVQPDLTRGRARARDLEHPRRHAQARVGGDHLDAGYPLGPVAAFLGGEPGPVARVRAVQPVCLGAGPVRERLGRPQVRVEVTVG